MKTAILRPVLLLIGLNVIIKPLWIVGIDRQVQLLEGPEVYGRFFALFQLSLMFHVILDAGIQTFLSQQKGKNTALSSDFIHRLGITKIILSFIYFSFSMALAFVLALLCSGAFQNSQTKQGNAKPSGQNIHKHTKPIMDTWCA